MMSNGLLWHFVSVNDLDYDIPSIDFVLVVSEFPDVFSDDLVGEPPSREIDFGIDLGLDAKTI